MERKMFGSASPLIFQRASELRNNETHAEMVLWEYLRLKPEGYKFRRQHPYAVYILDFYCHKLKLVIEVDGPIHNLNEVKQNDQQRQIFLEKSGLTVMRFTNETVISKLDVVINCIKEFIGKKTDEHE